MESTVFVYRFLLGWSSIPYNYLVMEKSDSKYTPLTGQKQLLAEEKQQTDGIWISREKELTTIGALNRSHTWLWL